MPTPSSVDSLLDGPHGAGAIYLLDAATDLELRLIRDWLLAQRAEAETVRIASSRRRVEGDDTRLLSRLDRGDDPYLVPIRVVWMAPERKGRRSVGWSDALKPGDPRDPRGLLALWTRMAHPDRIEVIAGRGARASELERDHEASRERDGLAAFITRRAWRVLDQAERRLRGNRYKIPRFVPEAILSRQEFVEAVHRFADHTGTPREETLATAEGHLRKIAATHSPYVIDLIANAIHSLYRQGYREIRYDPEAVRRVAELGSRNPIVFLPSHRSNLDRLALQFMLWENDLPPNHTAGGVNIDFFPVGPLLRRTGVFFIRRSFRDDELYKIVLRAYIDYLIEKRLPLEWYLEGGRSRTGKLLPPRFGLLSYVVDSLRRGKTDDVKLIPVSIAYDHIQDVPGYARETQGMGKEKESLSWLLKAIRSMRRRYGDIHIRIAEPVSVVEVLDSIDDGEGESIGLQKLAFEVMHRIAMATPITPTAIVSIVLLASGGAPRALDDLTEDCRRLLDHIEDRDLPTTEEATTMDASVVAANLAWLAEHGNVTSEDRDGGRVFWLSDEQIARISYYRNMVAHFFVGRAIAEMALRSVAERTPSPSDAIREEMLEMRDLLKFEFFFPEKTEFLADVSAEIATHAPGWQQLVEAAGTHSVLSKMGLPTAHWVVLPILDGYAVVADELAGLSGLFEEKGFLRRCLARARRYRRDGKLKGESVNEAQFRSALALARNRGLLQNDDPEVEGRREVFAAEVAEARELAAPPA